MPRLNHKTALITGAARGIGRAITDRFAAEGAKVYATDIDVEGLAVYEGHDTIETFVLDVREPADWQRAEDQIRSLHGGLDILVNNAGITGFLETDGPHDPEHLDLDSWNAVHRVNSDGVALGCKHAISLMKHRQSGSIINIASRSGNVGIPGASAYAASKAAVRNHTKSVALYCAKAGYPIRCNSIHPAAILTEMWDAMLGSGAQREAIIRSVEAGIPMKRFGTPDEVAHAAVFLASDEASYITGSELHIDGGILAGAEAAPAQSD